MKSQRLKNFCQLCRKSCKDQNGYHCHLNSASHQAKVREFATNPEQHLEKYSKELEWKIVQILKTKYPGEPKYLEEIYNQYSEEKKHIKFNHTQWRNLKQFGEHLRTVRNIQIIGNPPDCKILYLVSKAVDFIEKNKKQKIENIKEKEKQQFEQKLAKRIEKQKCYEQTKLEKLNYELEKLERQNKQIIIPERLEINIEGFGQGNKRLAFISTEELQRQMKLHSSEEPLYTKKYDKIQALFQELVKEDNKHSVQNEEIQEVQWIQPNIIVKIKPHEIDTVFHNRKCKVVRIVEPYLAQVSIGTALIDIDQSNLQTVIPKINNAVMLLNGAEKGKIGFLREVHMEEGYGDVEVEGKRMKMSFNSICKIDEN